VKVRDIVKLIESDGWYWYEQKEVIINTNTPENLDSSQCQAGRGMNMAVGTLNNILKQAGLKQ